MASRQARKTAAQVEELAAVKIYIQVAACEDPHEGRDDDQPQG